MTDKEKKAIDLLKNIDKQKCLMLNCPVVKNNIERQLKIIELNRIIRKQSKEIEHQIEKRANQRNELAILNAKQVEFNKLVNTVNSYKGQFKRQQKEIEELYQDNITLIQEINQRWLDKIKAKIEELQEDIKYSANPLSIDNSKFAIKVLQSLLEKE